MLVAFLLRVAVLSEILAKSSESPWITSVARFYAGAVIGFHMSINNTTNYVKLRWIGSIRDNLHSDQHFPQSAKAS